MIFCSKKCSFFVVNIYIFSGVHSTVNENCQLKMLNAACKWSSNGLLLNMV